MDTQSLTDDEKKKLTPEEEAAVARSMLRAGIAAKYHGKDKTLKIFGAAGTRILTEMDKPEFMPSVLSGKGYLVCGADSTKSYDFSVMFTRALRIMRIDARVINLISLAKHVCEGDVSDSRFSNFESTRALMITRFCEPMDHLPLTRPEFFKIENFLYGLMESNISISVQYSGDLEKNKWWSDYFTKRLFTLNDKIEVI